MEDSDIRSETDEFFRASADGACPEQLPYSEGMLERRREFKELVLKKRLATMGEAKSPVRGINRQYISSQIPTLAYPFLKIVVVVALIFTIRTTIHHISNIKNVSNKPKIFARVYAINLGAKIGKIIKEAIAEGDNCYMQMSINGKSYQLPIKNVYMSNNRIYHTKESKNQYYLPLTENEAKFEMEIFKVTKNNEVISVIKHVSFMNQHEVNHENITMINIPTNDSEREPFSVDENDITFVLDAVDADAQGNPINNK